jgi:hypothetical protein
MGPELQIFVYGEGRLGLKQASIWWKDIWRLGSEEDGGWFGSNISSWLGDGKDIGFWKEKWIGTVPLRDSFSKLFNKYLQQDCRTSAMGNWESNKWRWKFDWTTKLSAAETVSAHDILMLLDHIRPRRDPSDRWKWPPHAAGLFSVNSTYVCLLNKYVTDALDPNTVLALNKLWIINAPSKASIFG